MNALSHPLLHLSLKIAVGVACTVATGMVVTYGLQYIIRDHNSLALRRELRARKRKILDVLKGIEAECCGAVETQIDAVRQCLEGGAAAAVAVAAESQDGAVHSIPQSISPRKTRASSPRHTKGPAATALKSSPPPLPALAIPASGLGDSVPSPFATPLSPSSHPSATLLSVAAVDRQLREADDSLLRILEKLDAVRPGEILEHAASATHSSVEIDADVKRVAEQAEELLRLKKKSLVRRAQGLVSEVDRLCGVAGIPSVGYQHAIHAL